MEKVLRRLQRSDQFVRKTHAVIEAWCPCIGNADYAVRLFGLSLESLRRASAELRNEIAGEPGAPSSIRVTTGSIAGSTMCEMLSPSATMQVMAELHSKVAGPAAQNKGNSFPFTAVDSAYIVALVQAAVIDTVCQLQDLVEGVAGGTDETLGPALESLRQQLDTVLKDERDAFLQRGSNGWELKPMVQESLERPIVNTEARGNDLIDGQTEPSKVE